MRAVERFLESIHRHPRWGWAGLFAYAAAVTFPHEQVQLVVGALANQIGLEHVYEVSAAVAVAQGALLSAIVLKQLAGRPERRMVIAFWLLTLALIAGSWRLLTANNTELVHYPQYVPEGMALLALTLSPAESVAWVAVLGGLDEGFQYSFLTNGRAVPYDFNDIYMDLLGGAAGVVLAMSFLHCEAARPGWKRVLLKPGIAAVLAICAIGTALWASGLMLLIEDKTNPHYWFAISRSTVGGPWLVQRIWGPNKFHELLPAEGTILILGTIALFALLDRRWRRPL